MAASLNTLSPRQNGRHFSDIFQYIFLNENVWIPIKISLKFVPMGPFNNIQALVQIMDWCRSGDKPLSEPMMRLVYRHLYASLGLNELKHHLVHCYGVFFFNKNPPSTLAQCSTNKHFVRTIEPLNNTLYHKVTLHTRSMTMENVQDIDRTELTYRTVHA